MYEGWCGVDDAVAVGAVFETGGVRVMVVVLVGWSVYGGCVVVLR